MFKGLVYIWGSGIFLSGRILPQTCAFPVLRRSGISSHGPWPRPVTSIISDRSGSGPSSAVAMGHTRSLHPFLPSPTPLPKIQLLPVPLVVPKVFMALPPLESVGLVLREPHFRWKGESVNSETVKAKQTHFPFTQGEAGLPTFLLQTRGSRCKPERRNKIL